MRRILIVLLMLTAGVAHARILHVGDNTIKLSQTKTTTPALHVRVGDEVWYGNMTRCPMPMNENTDKKLRVKYNGADYYVSETGKDYVIVDGKLVAVNCNVYLESTGTQWIDTGLFATQDTSVKLMIHVYHTPGYASLVFGARRRFNDIQSFDISAGYNKGQHWFFNYGGTYNPESTPYLNDWQKHEIYFNKNNVYMDNKLLWSTTYVKDFETPLTMYLFDVNDMDGMFSGPLKGRIWYAMLWDDDTLVRHFVPVPCGLKIGDFVVPENGMWDIVEQKFYGNMGTGEFIYGVDG